MTENTPKNILVVRVGRVGDTVMMTPALNALLQYYPDASFTLLLSPVGRHLMKDFHPHVKAMWTWDRSGLLKPYKDKRRLARQLKSSRFDLVICFDTSRHIAKLFNDTGVDFHQHKGAAKNTHTARSYLNFVADVCHREFVDTYNYLPVNDTELASVDNELMQHNIRPDDPVLMIHPTFSGYSPVAIRKREAKLRKLWNPENYGRLCKKIRQNHPDIRMLMVLLPDELSFGEKIVEHSDNAVLLLRSESTFERYKAMIKRANVLLSPDSGPMHIASALGTKIIAFFSMKDPGNCGPYMPATEFIVLRSEETEHPERGINAIAVDTVYDACLKLLTDNA